MGFGVGGNYAVVMAKQSALATRPAAGSGAYVRRNKFDLKRGRALIASGERRASFMMAADRLGMANVTGDWTVDLVPGAARIQVASFLRGSFGAAVTTGALTTITSAATGPHFVRSGGSFLTDGFRIGQVVRASGFAAPATANNAKNLIIIAVTALNMTVVAIDGSAIVAKAAGDSVTIALQGKQVFTPVTGKVTDYYEIERWQPDVPSYVSFQDMRPSQMAINANASGMATLSMQWIGRDTTAPSATAYFTAPAAAVTGTAAIGVTGLVVANGAVVTVLTGLQLNCNGNLTTEAVLGATTTPDVFDGDIGIRGSFTALQADDFWHTLVRNEGEATLILVMAAGTAVNSAFTSIVLPRVKPLMQDLPDTTGALKQTIEFQCPENEAPGADSYATQLVYQDSTA